MVMVFLGPRWQWLFTGATALVAVLADWFTEVHQLGSVTEGLRRAGFNQEETDKITHGNWLRLYRAVFGA